MKYQAVQAKYLLALKELKETKKELRLLYKGMQYGFLIIFFIILITYSLSGNIAWAQTQDIDYTWQENILYDDVLVASESDFNRVYPKAYEGDYPATFSFDNDTIGSAPSNWSTRQTGGSVLVVERKGNHSTVLELDDIGSNYVNARYDFASNPQENGTIEFYFYSTDVTKSHQIRFSGEFDVCIDMDVDNSYFRYFTGSYHNIAPAVSDTWYHISIDYECSTGGYDGLSQYDWNIEINGVEYGDYNFFQNHGFMDEFYIGSLNPDSSYTFYLDAFGIYPNDVNYSIGDNLIERLTVLDSFSVPLEYTLDSGFEQNTIDNAYYLDGNEWEILAQDLGGVYAVSIDFDLFNHYIYNITDIKVSYKIRVDSTTGDNLELNIEGVGNWNTTTGLLLFGINETVGSFVDHAINDVEIDNLQFGSGGFSMYIDLLRFDYSLLVDKCEFAFNGTGTLNNIGNDDVNGWTDIENVYNYPDVVNCYYSDDSLDRSIRIYSNGDGYAGIEKTFTHQYGTYYNISWQFDVNHWGRGGTYDCKTDVKIYSYDQTEIFNFRIVGYSIDGSPHVWRGDAYYYNGTDYIWLVDGLIPQDNMDFSLFWNNQGYDNFSFTIEGIDYSIPSLDNSKNGIGKIEIKSIINDPISIWEFIDIEIDYVAIYIDGIPYNDEGHTTQLFYYLAVDTWNMNEHNFIELDFDPLFSNNISIRVNDAFDVIDYGETLYQLDYWKNLYGSGNYPYPYLEIFNGTGTLGSGLLNVKIYGIMLVESFTSNEYSPTFTYNGIDIQESYFYIESGDLKYTMTTNDVGDEWIQLDFDLDDLYSRNKSFSINHRKDSTELFAEVRVLYSDTTFSYFESETSQLFESTILPQTKTIDGFQFLITDNDNDYNGLITGYFSDITLIYFPNIDTILPIINFIAIIPILVILFIIPMYIYIRFKKSWVFLPTVMIFSIIGTGAGIIPLWLTVVIIFSIISFYLIQRKASGG